MGKNKRKALPEESQEDGTGNTALEEEEVSGSRTEICLTGKEAFEKALRFLRRSGWFIPAREEIKRIPTNIIGLDWLLGGGLPVGRIVETFGFESSGKTTLAAECARAVQSVPKCVLYLDFEHSIDFKYFQRIGVNTTDDHLWLYEQPFCQEDGMQLAIDLIRTGAVGLLIVDSVAAMCPRDELEGKMEDSTIALQARVMGKTLRKLTGLLQKHNTIGFFVNQMREKIGITAKWSPTTTPGGRALKFYASVRLEMKYIGKDKTTGASNHRILLRKQKTAPIQSGVVEFAITSNGIDAYEHFKSCLFNFGVIENRNGSYFYNSDKLCRGDEELESLLQDEVKRKPLVGALSVAMAKIDGSTD